jgi:DnaK suppressor protein
MAMTKETILKYKQLLEAERKKLLQEIEVEEKSTEFGDDIDALDTEADEAEERSNVLAIQYALKERIGHIDEALSRMENNAYGVCTKCGAEISEKVLDAAPESALCEKCKKQYG